MKTLFFILLFVFGAYAAQSILRTLWNKSWELSDGLPIDKINYGDSAKMPDTSDLSESIVHSHLPFNVWFDPNDDV